MQAAVSQSLFSYWNALRGNRPAPKRFEIEPSRIANNLPDTFILERLNHSNIRFRLAGTRITDALGMELRGKNLFDLFSAEDAKTLESQMELITTQCVVGLFRMSAATVDGISVTFEILILPLTHVRDSVERYVGCIVPIDKPDWVGRVALANYTLVGHSIVWPDGTPRNAEDLAGRQAPLLLTRREARIVKSARRQFRVYEGGRNLPIEER
jgi:hypothetical protein